jgi:hypothetical protein
MRHPLIRRINRTESEEASTNSLSGTEGRPGRWAGMAAMNEFRDTGMLWLLRGAVAKSPIVVPAVKVSSAPAKDFAAWCERQVDIDAVVLSWIRSQVPVRSPSSFS